LPLDDYAVAQLAFKIERVDCGLQGGRQDQYSATFGGFNFMEFYAGERAIINPLRIKNWIVCELESSLLLFYTGISRESAKIIADQSDNVKSGAPEAIEAMHAMKNEALVMKECLLKGDFTGMVNAMRQGWESKKISAKSVSNPRLNELYNAALDAGALAGKVSGAGGGGFMIFFVPPERRMEVIRTLNAFGGQASNCYFTQNGSQAWTTFCKKYQPVYSRDASPERLDAVDPRQGQVVPAPHFGRKTGSAPWIPLPSQDITESPNVNV
jgi:D-glycero-alpha-D-manno-heptose-7-phosphate kinase